MGLLASVADKVESGAWSLQQVVYGGVLLCVLLVHVVRVVLTLFVGEFLAKCWLFCVAILGLRWLYTQGHGVFGLRVPFLVKNWDDVKAQIVSNPKQTNVLRFVCISDTHGLHDQLPMDQIPSGDVLVHTGDITHRGTLQEIRSFSEWLGKLPHKHKIVLAGNHDLCLDAVEYDHRWQKQWHHKEFQDPIEAKKILLSNSNATYLENQSVTIQGIKIFGSPMSLVIPKREPMAFQVDQGFGSKNYWNSKAQIPADVDVLLTHGPPKGILDRTFLGTHVGDDHLLLQVVTRCRPKFHVFGHIHESYGVSCVGRTVFINSSTSTFTGKMLHEPIVFDLPIPNANAGSERG